MSVCRLCYGGDIEIIFGLIFNFAAPTFVTDMKDERSGGDWRRIVYLFEFPKSEIYCMPPSSFYTFCTGFASRVMLPRGCIVCIWLPAEGL